MQLIYGTISYQKTMNEPPENVYSIEGQASNPQSPSSKKQVPQIQGNNPGNSRKEKLAPIFLQEAIARFNQFSASLYIFHSIPSQTIAFRKSTVYDKTCRFAIAQIDILTTLHKQPSSL
jgi:hypothetical protein